MFSSAVSSAVSPVDHGLYFNILQLGTPIVLPTAQRRSKVEKAVGKWAPTTQNRWRNKYQNAIVIFRLSSSFRLNVRQVLCTPPVNSGVVESHTVTPLSEYLTSCLVFAWPELSRVPFPELQGNSSHFTIIAAYWSLHFAVYKPIYCHIYCHIYCRCLRVLLTYL